MRSGNIVSIKCGY